MTIHELQSAETDLLYLHFGKRLRAAFDDTGKSHESLAATYGWSEKILDAWIAGDKDPQLHRIIDFLHDYKVSFDWLYCGEESMHR